MYVHYRITPYATRRYTIVILDHVNRRISLYTDGRLRPCVLDLVMINEEKYMKELTIARC